jgi:preprotein translocase subunit SecY
MTKPFRLAELYEDITSQIPNLKMSEVLTILIIDHLIIILTLVVIVVIVFVVVVDLLRRLLNLQHFRYHKYRR